MFKEGSIFLRDRGGDRSEGVLTEARAQRLHERYKRIIGANKEHLDGKSVLDLASNNGRWTWAAIDAGASYVLGIEGRQDLIDAGMSEFADIPPARFDFVCGDVYDAVEIASKMGRSSFDTILCLGLFYHISDHYRLIRVMRAFNPTCIIIDSAFFNRKSPEIRFHVEDAADPSMAIAEKQSAERALAGRATVGFLRLAAELSGYDLDFLPWKKSGTDYPKSVQEYLEDNPKGKRRMTARMIARPDKPVW